MESAMRSRDEESIETALNLERAINQEDFQLAKTYVAEEMKYNGPFGAREGADAYLDQIAKLRLKFRTQKTFVDGGDVCAFYDIEIAQLKVPACGWFKVKDRKVTSLQVFFDPRPMLKLGGGHSSAQA